MKKKAATISQIGQPLLSATLLISVTCLVTSGMSAEASGATQPFLSSDEARAPAAVNSLLTAPTWIARGGVIDALFGTSVASAGDVNGDGYDDVVAGAPGFDNGQHNVGRVFVYHGGPAGPSNTFSWTVKSAAGGVAFGYSVASAGDVNADGYDDVIVGDFDYFDGELGEGQALVYHGGPTGLSTTPAWTVEGGQQFAGFGIAVSTAGDVNGDGYSDVIVGAFTAGEQSQGRVYVYHGSVSGLATTPSWTAEGDGDYSRFGVSVSTAGDVNDDGHDDVIVGAHSYTDTMTYQGKAYVYHGSASGLAASPAWSVPGQQGFEFFGASVSTAGDVNDDGYDDVLVGAIGYDNGELEEGRASVYPGSSTGLSTIPVWTAETNVAFAQFGYSVAAVDVNRDGFPDMIVGAASHTNPQYNEGQALAYLGSPTGPSTTPVWAVEGDRESARFGWSVAAAGDVNADGFPDVIVGAPNDNQGLPDEGGAYVFLGSGDGTAPAAGSASSLAIARDAAGQLTLSWGDSCLGTDTDYAVYSGTIGAFSSHAPQSCSTAGLTTTTLAPGSGSRYYLVVPLNATREGSYGRSSAEVERPAGVPVCWPQQADACD